MGRVRKLIQVDGHAVWTLFDTGSKNTYIVASATGDLPSISLATPRKVALGGQTHHLTRRCFIDATIEGKGIEGDAYVVDRLGVDEEGKNIEMVFGALLMQQWGIRVCPDTESLDLTHYPEEFVEF